MRKYGLWLMSLCALVGLCVLYSLGSAAAAESEAGAGLEARFETGLEAGLEAGLESGHEAELEAKSSEPRARVIRVGSFGIDHFLEPDFNGEMSGYAADFLNEIAKYTAWRYDYVSGSWAECLNWLREGKIDLLFPAEKSAEREKEFLFSTESCCMDFVALYTRSGNKSLGYEDYASFEGITVGMLTGNELNTFFERFLKEKKLSVRRVYFNSASSLRGALWDGSLDAIVFGAMNEDANQKLLTKIAYIPAYFMLSKNNAALLEDLNQALSALYLRNPYFAGKLYERHYRDFDRQAVGYSLKEMELIQASGPIRVACDADAYPFEWYDATSGGYKGIYPDLLRKVAGFSGLSLDFLPPSKQDPWQRVKDKKAHMLTSVVAHSNLRESHGIVSTDSYFKTNYTLIGRRGAYFEPARPHSVAVEKDQVSAQHYILNLHPHWRIVPFPRLKDCLEAVSRGEADVACVNSISMQVDPYLDPTDDLVSLFTAPLTLPVRLGVSEDWGDLVPILNKAIRKLTDKDIEQAVLANTFDAKRKVSLSGLVSYFPKLSLALASLFSCLLLFFCFMVYRNRWHRKQNRLLEENYRQLQEVTRQKEELQSKSETDTLTGLYHKAAFIRRAKALLQLPDARYMLCFLDMDYFKTLNDSYGHVAGDETLMALAGILRRHFREQDLVGRFGGDEFFVFMPCLSEEAFQRKINDVELDMAQYHMDKDRDPLYFTMSVGLARSPDDGVTFEELLAGADSALYRAKENGRNRVEMFCHCPSDTARTGKTKEQE